MTVNVVEEWVAEVDVAVEDLEVPVVEAVEVPEDVEASVSLTASPETPGPASRPRRRGAAAARGTGATSRTTSRWVSVMTYPCHYDDNLCCDLDDLYNG